jgi:putative effector of murein hydrolase
MRKQQNFSQPVFTQNTYAGEFAGKYIAAALLSAKTLDNQYITIMPNVKYKSVIQSVAVDSIVNDASCNFTTSGTVALSERILEPKELQVNLELCKQEFVASWEALQLGYSAFDEIPKDFNDFLISYVAGKVAQATEESIWRGVAATNGQFQGIYTALSSSVVAGGTTAPVTSSVSGSITSANVLTALDALVNSIPNTVYGKEDVMIYVPTNVVKAYQQALSGGTAGANGWNNQMNVGEKPLNFQGIELAFCPGLAASAMVAAQKSNLYFGTGLLSDHNEVRVLDMANLDGSQNYRIIMRYTAGTQYGIGNDIAIHKNY